MSNTLKLKGGMKEIPMTAKPVMTKRDEDMVFKAYHVRKKGAEAQEKFIARIQKDGLAFSIKWMGSELEDVLQAALMENVIRHIEGGYHIREACEMARTGLVSMMISDQLRGGSSSQWSNMHEAAQRAAAARMISDLAWYLDCE